MLKLVRLREGAVACRTLDGVGDLAVLVHAGRSIAVELAKAAFKRVLVQESVDAGEGEHSIVAAGEQDKLFQSFVEVEDAAIVGVGQIVLDHLYEDSVRSLGDVAQRAPRFVVEQARHEGAGHHLVMHDRRRILHVVVSGPASCQVATQICHCVEVFFGKACVAAHMPSFPVFA